MPQPIPCLASLANLSQYVFGDLGFRGNRAHYDDPRNSYLNEVLDRRLGIPITLAVVYLELGKRLSFSLAGVNFSASLPSCAALKATSRSSSIPLPTALLSMASPWASGYRSSRAADSNWPLSSSNRPRRCNILARMLRNLKRLHFQAREFSTAIHWAEKIAYLQPDEAENYREPRLPLPPHPRVSQGH